MITQSPSFRLKDVSVRTKFLVSTLMLTAIMIVVGSIGIWGMSQIQGNLNSVSTQQMAKVRVINAMRLDYALFIADTASVVATTNLNQVRGIFGDMKNQVDALSADTKTYLAMPHQPGEQHDVTTIKNTLPAIVQNLQPFVASGLASPATAVAELSYAINHPDASTQGYTDVQGAFAHLLTFLNGYVNQIRVDSENSFHQLLATMIVLMVLGAIASFVIGQFMAHIIIKPLDATVRVVQAIAQGDLRSLEHFTRDYGSKDAFGQLTYAISDMVEGLRTLIANIQDTMGRFTTDSLQITVAVKQTSQATEQVAQTVQQVATDATNQSHDLTDVARQVDQLGIVIADSRSQAQVTAQSMQTLNENNQATAKIVKRLGDRSAEIGQIIQTITEIAEQTNLLALNAAIEAARAGEQGRGFAVVADEVRKLAERSTTATKEISTIVREVQESTQNTVTVIESGVTEMAQGVERTEATSRVLAVIANSSETINAALAQVAGVSEATSVSSESVSAAVEEITAQMLEATTATQNLARIAQDLQESILQFQLGDEPTTDPSDHYEPVVSSLQLVA